MTRDEWKKADATIFMKGPNGFFLGFFNPSDDLLAHKKDMDEIAKMVENLNTKDNFINYQLVIGKKVAANNPGI